MASWSFSNWSCGRMMWAWSSSVVTYFLISCRTVQRFWAAVLLRTTGHPGYLARGRTVRLTLCYQCFLFWDMWLRISGRHVFPKFSDHFKWTSQSITGLFTVDQNWRQFGHFPIVAAEGAGVWFSTAVIHVCVPLEPSSQFKSSSFQIRWIVVL